MRHNNRQFDKSSYDSNDQRAKDAIVAVSYTHLTLPTIYSV